jgi:regulator of replication initiation timing
MPNTKFQGNNNLANQLVEQEKFISRKSQEWYLEGKALLEIRDKELYLGKYVSFDKYCHRKWRFTKRYANMQISGYLFVSRLGTMVPILPANERQARPFTGLNPELQQAAWVEALRTAPNGEITSDHAHAVAKKYKTGSHSPGTKTGTGKIEDITASTFQPSSVLQLPPPVDLSSNQASEELVQLRKQLEEERNYRIQLQNEAAIKDQEINNLRSEVSAAHGYIGALAKHVQENQLQITSLKYQINTMQHQITNLRNQVGQSIGEYKDLHFIHGHLTVHAYNLQEALKKVKIESNVWYEKFLETLKRVPEAETEQTEEKIVPFVRKGLEQESEQWRAGR